MTTRKRRSQTNIDDGSGRIFMDGEGLPQKISLYINSGERLLYTGTTFSKIQEEERAVVINQYPRRIPFFQFRPSLKCFGSTTDPRKTLNSPQF